ncbi:MAG TPA: cupredoxin family copper-binding protein [Candidatus Methylomirabilis sp.]|nr:cupredoxin family copper-binding protein [Candidatus Methylomirabilis sp.]
MSGSRDRRRGSRIGPWRGLLTIALVALAVMSADVRAQAPAAVDIKDSKYLPATITVPVGTTVRWTNHDEETHTVTSTTGSFGSMGLDLDEAYTFTFTTPGTYPYGCDLHPFMGGTVVVQ